MSSFDLQPTLRGNTISSRPLHNDDFDALYAAASDPLISEQHPEPLRYERSLFRKFFSDALDSGGARSWRAISRDRLYLPVSQSLGRRDEADVVWFHVGKDNWRSRRAMEKIDARLSHMADRVVNGVAEEYAYYCVARPGAELTR